MNPRTLPIFDDISFNEWPIEQYVPMQPLHPAVFDRFCADGWCYWSDLLFRRNLWEWRGMPCRVIILRVNLRDFRLSKSQRKCLRRNIDLQTMHKPLRIASEHIDLFHRHSARFHHNRPGSISGFFSPFSHLMPCNGFEFNVFKDNQLMASSFFHMGDISMAGNYCIYDPDVAADRSLGTFTMLLEISVAREMGLTYYYPGFVYDLPSEFDYKLSLHGLEYFDWSGNWYPLERLPVRDWREAWTIE